MESYARPSVDGPIVHDVEGHVIDYGNRWGGGPPPEESYSVETHPERFAPLHTIADSLIAHLRETCDVDVDEGAEAATDLLRPVSDVLRAVRVRPNDPRCAPLTFVFTAYPGIVLHAGLLHDFHHPACGCDACDATWETEADELERQVFGVVAGNYRESIERGSRPWVEYELTFPDGASSGRSRARDMPTRRLGAAAPTLRRIFGRWSAWPRAAGAS